MVRLGHTLTHVDIRSILPNTIWVDRIIWRIGGRPFSRIIHGNLIKYLAHNHWDITFVDGGELMPEKTLLALSEAGSQIINYNIDDPFGGRDKRRYSQFLQALRHYDLCVVMRDPNVAEAIALGAKNVTRVFMSADEISHSPRKLTDADKLEWASEVLFVGTWMPERGSFLLHLLEAGVPLTIRGNNWQKSPEWSQLKKCWAGGAIIGDNYAKAIQCAKVCIGLLSKGNRDLHTTRSLEIPALGGLLCAERTPEHQALYADGKEAVFWSSVDECIQVCRKLLHSAELRKQIACAGQRRMRANGNFNEPVLRQVLSGVIGSRTE